MAKINSNYSKLKESYLFGRIAAKVNEYEAANPDKNVIRMGIGDVTLPLCEEVIKGLEAGVADMAKAETFKGYGPEQGHKFLQEAVKEYYAKKDVALDTSEIFISDGAKSDVGNVLDLFAQDNVVLVPDPVYPVYVDTNVMDGREIKYMNANKENDFLPGPDYNVDADIIYLCSPNNPTGAAYSKAQLKEWVDYAKAKDAVILFDAAYEAFVIDDAIATSIMQVEGAKEVAIEFCSLSKTAGFTGARCGYTVVPKELIREETSLNRMWNRRQTTKFNGASYIVQRGAVNVFTEEGQKQVKENINYYRENAKIITDTLDELGIYYTGGKNSPYIWMQCPKGMDSWGFFDFLLEEANVVGTPGEGFGSNGEGFFRLTTFSTHEKTAEAMKRLKKVLE